MPSDVQTDGTMLEVYEIVHDGVAILVIPGSLTRTDLELNLRDSVSKSRLDQH